MLLARVGRPTSTNALIDLIWGDDVPASALNVIQKYVGALRRVLEPLLPARGIGSFLHRRGNSYLFTAGPGTLDLVAFRGHVDAARTALAQPFGPRCACMVALGGNVIVQRGCAVVPPHGPLT